MTSNAGEENIFYIGNIYSGILEDRRIALIKEYDDNPCTSIEGDCKECLLNNICDGGCVANNYLITGYIYKLPKVYCWWRQFLLDEAIYIIGCTFGNVLSWTYVENDVMALVISGYGAGTYLLYCD
jgi:radical SAM protein with 4Fe4S-binding SPASM domain